MQNLSLFLLTHAVSRLGPHSKCAVPEERMEEVHSERYHPLDRPRILRATTLRHCARAVVFQRGY